jgi:phosphonopyruvate decarboxylase
MIDPRTFLEALQAHGVELFTGVPDSLLKSLNAEILRTVPRERHVIAANEGGAVGLAIGHHLRTGGTAAVYLQNSGFGNTVNPLLSLADPDVYGIPMLVIVGWRGQPGVADEPQHVKQGRVMTQLLDALELPWRVLPHDQDEALAAMADSLADAREGNCPALLLVEKGTFADAPGAVPDVGPGGDETATREQALDALVESLGDEVIAIGTTGMLSRELFELREAAGGGGERDFLTVGGMGHATSIAFGVALDEPDREVWCLDGDGALLMHLGTLAVIADHAPDNYFHVVINNGVHGSVGGQPTSIGVVDVPATAQALGYRWAASTTRVDEIPALVATMREQAGPCLLEVRVRPGNRSDLGRPTRTPAQAKRAFMAALGVGGPSSQPPERA